MCKDVLEKIVANKFCVGCGTCVGVLPDILRIYTDKYGAYLPELKQNTKEEWGSLSLQVCPFANNHENEDTIAAQRFGCQEEIKHRAETGYYLRCFIGHINDHEAHEESTSGGIVTWLASAMLSQKKVEAVACVGPSNRNECLFEYKLIRDRADLRRCKKSRYYPVEVSGIISQIRQTREKILFIGLPCFIKALKLASQADPLLRERIIYYIGLFCGHLKTKQYAAYLSRCCGVSEKEIISVNFRKKIPGNPSNKYAFEVWHHSQGSKKHSKIMMEDVWSNSWNYNLFMLKACEFCDDVLAETADISVGDAWLPEYCQDYRGNSIVIARKKEMLELLREGVEGKQLTLQETSIDKVIQSQAGGIRQRRAGLQYRLYLMDKKGNWRPRKRLRADRKVGSIFFRLIQLLRIRTRILSHEAFLKQQTQAGLEIFISALKPWILCHRLINIIRHIPGRIVRNIMGRLRSPFK